MTALFIILGVIGVLYALALIASVILTNWLKDALK